MTDLTDRLLLATIGFWWVGLLLLAVFRTGHRVNLLIGLSASFLLLGVRELLRRGQAVPAAALGVGMGWTVFTLYLYNLGTPFSVHLLGYMAVVIFAAWVGGARAGLAISLLSGITVSALARAEMAGLLPPAAVMSPFALTLDLVAYLGVCTLLIALTRANFVRSLRLAYDEVALRREAEAALRDLNASLEQRVIARTADFSASEARYRTLLALSPDGIGVVDRAGRILYCNEQLAHLYGQESAAEMTGRTAAEFSPQGYTALYNAAAADLEPDGRVARHIEIVIDQPSGAHITVEYSVARVPWSGALEDEAFLATMRDITQRKAAEAELLSYRNHLEDLVQERTRELHAEIAERAAAQEALQRSEASLKAAERLAGLGSWERDLVGEGLYVSEGLYRILGFDPALPPWEVYAAAWEAVHPDDVAPTRAAIARAERAAKPQKFTFRYRLPSGETRKLEVVTETPCDSSGKIVRMRATGRDITEQAQMLAALERSETHLAAAQHLAQVGSWERNLSTDRYFFSKEMYRIFGLEPWYSDTISDRFWSILHRDDQDTAYALFRAVIETGVPQEATHRIVTPAGEERIVRALTQLTRHADGRPATVHGTVQDITEQEQTRVALAQRVKELSILGKLGNLVSFRHPLGEIIQIYLDRFCELANVDLAQVFLLREGRLHLVGTSRNPPGGGGAQAPVLNLGERLCGTAAAEGRAVHSYEIGGRVPCARTDCCLNGVRSLVALPLRDGEGVFGVLTLGANSAAAFDGQTAFLETIVDLVAGRLQNALLYQETRDRAAGLEETVAERTRELQAERDRTQAILETVGESVVVVDPDGCVLYANPATMQLTGAMRDEILGRPLWQCWSSPMSREIWLRAQQALTAGRSWHGDTIGQRKDGTRYAAALTATPLYDEINAAAPCGSVWVQRDITTVKEAERLKDRFVSNVSHELRTPISVIGLSCDNLATFGDRLADSDRSQMFQDIHEQAHVLSSLIEDILTLSQIDSGRAQQPWQDIDLARLVHEQAGRQRPLAEGRSQALMVSASGPVMVRGSAVQLQQVVRNLLDNAIKYTPQGGQIWCTCETRAGPASAPEASAPDSHTWAVVEVRDSGIGVPAEAIPLLFERFYRVKEESEVPGTGLGLPIARELVLLHGGLISVVSTPGEGSIFTVYLPLHEERDTRQTGYDIGA